MAKKPNQVAVVSWLPYRRSIGERALITIANFKHLLLKIIL